VVTLSKVADRPINSTRLNAVTTDITSLPSGQTDGLCDKRATSVPLPPLTRQVSNRAAGFQIESNTSCRQRMGLASLLPYSNEGGEVMMTVAASEPARQTKPQTTAAFHELLQRIEGEYREMPGLSVTARQAERLWGLNTTTCAFVLMTLMQHGILKRTASGTYIRG
jgi:hypothetical protein